MYILRRWRARACVVTVMYSHHLHDVELLCMGDESVLELNALHLDPSSSTKADISPSLFCPPLWETLCWWQANAARVSEKLK